MNYIWEVALRAQAQGIPAEGLSFVPAEPSSPYMEAAFVDMNQQSLAEPEVEVNGMYRFPSVFQALLTRGFSEEYPELRDALFDILTHELLLYDMRQGLSRQEYYKQFLKRELLEGGFGEKYADVEAVFPRDELASLLDSLLRLFRTGPSLLLLRSLLRRIFPASIVYLNTDGKRELLVYIGERETPERRRKMDFLKDFFVPFDYPVHLFWERHFGIIGVDVTMTPDDIFLY